MPIFRIGPKLVYYAHVPKCGGMAVEQYLQARFSPLAFVDSQHHSRPSEVRWSRTSPQHVHLEVLTRLFPEGFFDASFAVVRHPVARLISAYHFQLEIERSIRRDEAFSDWLLMLPERMEENPFVFDNHTRPMAELVPDAAKIFYLEHGLDAIVPWLDDLAGEPTGPRAMRRVNERKAGSKEKVQPSSSDLDFIARFYAKDLERFGYVIDHPRPSAPAPKLSPEFVAERDAELVRKTRPTHWLRKQIDRVVR